jgi:hypothetical protein
MLQLVRRRVIVDILSAGNRLYGAGAPNGLMGGIPHPAHPCLVALREEAG